MLQLIGNSVNNKLPILVTSQSISDCSAVENKIWHVSDPPCLAYSRLTSKVFTVKRAIYHSYAVTYE